MHPAITKVNHNIFISQETRFLCHHIQGTKKHFPMDVTEPTYPSNWPSNPFHTGEVQVQQRYPGLQDQVMSYAPKFIRPFMPDQHRLFYEAQPFLVAAARDERGRLWSTLLTHPTGTSGFVTSPTPESLLIQTRLLEGDALSNSFIDGSDLGLLGIEFESKRRNRVNGRVNSRSEPSDKGIITVSFKVDQAFGNCPQYIKPRKWWSMRASDRETSDIDAYAQRPIKSSNHLSPSQINEIRRAETIFIASGYRGESDDPRYGNDASHRGGPAGFVRVLSKNKLILPDFSGNKHFNTIGNLVKDPSLGISVPAFSLGGMVQMTGTATVDFDPEKANLLYPGAQRLIFFTVEEVVTIESGSIPILWSIDNDRMEKQKLRITAKVQESDDITSFYLKSDDGRPLQKFKAGNHLPISVKMGDRQVDRTYSLSGGPQAEGYRISVKREPMGLVSGYLHSQLSVGDVIEAQQPAGDFILDADSNRHIVLLSAGVGVTPILSMLHEYVDRKENTYRDREAFWVHGARNGSSDAFRDEVDALTATGNVSTHVFYSRAVKDDSIHAVSGRINIKLLQDIIPFSMDLCDYYICGPSSFVADLDEALQQTGVQLSSIKYETF